jgi:hypothetical protein
MNRRRAIAWALAAAWVAALVACSASSAIDDAGSPMPNADASGDTTLGAGGDGSATSDASANADAYLDAGDEDALPACVGTAPATVTLLLPEAGVGTWIADGGDLVGVAHPSSSLPCSTCHLACDAGATNMLIGYDHSDPQLVCNYCHDPSTRVIAIHERSRSMANYRSRVDTEVCTCCHNGTNNPARGFPPAPGTPIVPGICEPDADIWQLVYPTLDAATGAFGGGQFQGN